MKNNLLPAKSLFLATALFSLFAFLAVNVHANLIDQQTNVCAGLLPAKMEENAPAQRNLPLPSLTVVERVLEIAGHFLPISH